MLIVAPPGHPTADGLLPMATTIPSYLYFCTNHNTSRRVTDTDNSLSLTTERCSLFWFLVLVRPPHSSLLIHSSPLLSSASTLSRALPAWWTVLCKASASDHYIFDSPPRWVDMCLYRLCLCSLYCREHSPLG